VTAAAPAARPKRKGFDRGAFYRLCRMLHAYLSAFAFLALIFFSVTGLLLDHPDWLQGRAREHEARFALPLAVLRSAGRARDPQAALALEVARRTPVVGAYKSGETDDGQANLRFEGVKGSTTAVVDLASGQADVTVDHASATSLVEDLHRGKNAGAAWRLVIDVSAVLITALSVIGYVLFFSLRFRLRTSLILTVVSLSVLVAIAWLFTP
jgi:uncharacterized protein